MVRFYKFLAFSCFFSFYSCVPIIHNKQKFTLEGESNITAIKTKGYYYTLDYSKEKESKYIVTRILFKNGLFRQIGSIHSKSNSEYFSKKCFIEQNNTYKNSIMNFDCMLNNYNYFFKIKTNFISRNAQVWNWGRVEIINNKIKIQYFYNFHGDYYLFEENGEVLNPESFRITSNYDYKTKEKSEVNYTYFFKEHEVDSILENKPNKW